MIKSHDKSRDADESQTVNKPSFSAILRDTSLLKPLSISVALMFFQQFSGINAVVYYSVTIFEEAGSSIDRFMSSISIGVVQLACTLLSAFLVSFSNNSFNSMTICIESHFINEMFAGWSFWKENTADSFRNIYDPLIIWLGNLLVFEIKFGYWAIGWSRMDSIVLLDFVCCRLFGRIWCHSILDYGRTVSIAISTLDEYILYFF